jgi:rRNA maturation endonuclease Nob1
LILSKKEKEVIEVIRIKCRSCGSLNEEDARFCKGCGAPM